MTSASRTEIHEPDATWLSWLEDAIWQEGTTDRFGSTWWHEKRELTTEELERVLSLARSGDYIISMYNAVMGFGIGITLFNPPPYPGTEAIPLLSITNKHISTEARFKDGWDIFSPIALSDANQRAHEFAFAKRLRTDRYHYDY